MHLAPRFPLPYNIGMKEAAWMIIREYGDSAARVILVQPVGQHELPLIDDEIVQIGQMTDRPFRYLAV